ncbi:lipase family protein [Thermosynechococcaceae cyanobacterium BACA0444]|uniref:Lipase family protein n=1 Tax=Pseudocalidococcus azoricus BACA0444 TaxID=2918990 RepID=A0AAE4FW51_9CYAN|nr:lipase family protein [Pseudocalidococcus azoricus]MDS3862404.1 lipase family protein [Pseudocalidococcus azoricus BACA0444]
MTIHRVSPYKTRLDKGNAYWMAQLASQSYIKETNSVKPSVKPDKVKILENLKKIDDEFIEVYSFDEHSSQAILVDHQKYFCMAFRGTDQLIDWIDNINAFPVKQLFGEFHRGFWNSVEAIWDQIYNQYKRLNNLKVRKPLFLTGHSLGGAMAVIAGSKLIHVDEPFTNIYTFGQPRVMTRNTARIFNIESKTRCFRFNNNNDLVTRAPSRLMGYSHVGTYLHILEDGTIEQELGFWHQFIDSFYGAIESLKEKGIDGVEDHDMGKYLDAITNWKFRDR